MQGLCAEKNTIGLRKRLIAALYSRSPTKNSRIVIRPPIGETALYSRSPTKNSRIVIRRAKACPPKWARFYC